MLRIRYIEKHNIKLVLMFLVLPFVFSLTLKYASNMIDFRNYGPVYFASYTLIPLSILISISTLLALLHYNARNKFFVITFLFSSYLIKVIILYYMFEGHVNYDTPIHYVIALYLVDQGFNQNYPYHYWPLSLIEINIVRIVVNITYPYDTSLTAVISGFILPLTIYILTRLFLTQDNSIIALAIYNIFAPYIVHFCPQLLSVTMYIIAVYLISMVISNKAVIRNNLSLFVVIFISLLLSHAMLPISLGLSILIYFISLILIHVFTRMHFNKNRLQHILLLTMATVILLFMYNLFFTIFITRDIIKTINLIIFGEQVRLGVYNVSVHSHDLTWQYMLLRLITRVATIALIGVPTIYIMVMIFHKLLFRLQISEDKNLSIILLLLSIISVNTFLYLPNIFFQVGMLERFFQLSIYLSSVLSSYFYTYLIKKQKKTLFIIYKLLILLFSSFSIFITPIYQNISWFLDERDIHMAKWIANYISSDIIYLDGTGYVNHLVVYYLYPKRLLSQSIFLRSNIDTDILRNSGYPYPYSTLITTTSMTVFKPSEIQSIPDILIKQYLLSLREKYSLIFNNDPNNCYIPITIHHG